MINGVGGLTYVLCPSHVMRARSSGATMRYIETSFSNCEACNEPLTMNVFDSTQKFDFVGFCKKL